MQHLASHTRRLTTAAATFLRQAPARFTIAMHVVLCWLVLAGPALAAKKKAVEAPPEKSYVMPYGVVIMLLALGILIICRPDRRAAEPLRKESD